MGAVLPTAVFTEAGGERQALLQCRPCEVYAFRPLAVAALQEPVDRAHGALRPAIDFVRALK
jgi:hypothetical protein